MPHPIEKILQDTLEHTKYSLVFLRRIAQAMQQQETEKVPHDWRSYTAWVRDPQSMQIVGRTETRASAAVYNKGPSDVILSNEWFDGPRAVADSTTARYGGVTRWLYLPSGSSQSIDSQGEIWAFSVNYGTGTNEIAQLEVIETLYRGLRGFTTSPLLPDGAAAHLLDDKPMSYDDPPERAPIL